MRSVSLIIGSAHQGRLLTEFSSLPRLLDRQPVLLAQRSVVVLRLQTVIPLEALSHLLARSATEAVDDAALILVRGLDELGNVGDDGPSRNEWGAGDRQ